jgi:hypothetical protein
LEKLLWLFCAKTPVDDAPTNISASSITALILKFPTMNLRLNISLYSSIVVLGPCPPRAIRCQTTATMPVRERVSASVSAEAASALASGLV